MNSIENDAWRFGNERVRCWQGLKIKEFAMNRLLSAAAFLLVIACSSVGMAKDRDHSARLALVTQFAGEPIPSVRFGIA